MPSRSSRYLPKEAAVAASTLERAVRKATGETADALRARTIEETRRVAEKRHGYRTRFISWFPFIGRGNVLRDCTISHEGVEAALDDALRDN
jgi:hypothetical protein